MANAVNVNFRMDPDLKRSMEEVCAEMGLNDFFFHLPRRIAAWKVFSQDVVFDSYGVLLTLLFLPQNIKRLFIGELTTLRHLL